MEERVSLPQRKKDESMRRVLREAKHLIEQKGYYNTTVRELCERCMISKTTFFNYFESKESIVRMIIDECADELQAYIGGELRQCGDAIERIRLAFCFMLDSLNRYSNLSGVFFQLVSESPAYRPSLRQFFDIVTPLIQEAQREGAIRSDVAAQSVMQMLEGLQFTAFYNASAEERNEVFTAAFHTWMRLLAQKDAGWME